MTNKHNRVLSTGVTGIFSARSIKTLKIFMRGFTSRYKVAQLVYFQIHVDPSTAIEREKQIKKRVKEPENHACGKRES